MWLCNTNGKKIPADGRKPAGEYNLKPCELRLSFVEQALQEAADTAAGAAKDTTTEQGAEQAVGRIATQYMTPVILLTDGYIANAAEPWAVPDPDTFAPFPAQFLDAPNGPDGTLLPYARDEKGARPWIKPGTPGLMHRIGGIEKNPGTGNLDYSPASHQAMTDARKAKVDGVAKSIPAQDVCLGSEGGKLAVVGWGSTFGPIHQAVRKARAQGLDVSHIHVRHIWPLPENLGDLLRGYDKILVPEMNTGQFKTVLRDQYLVDAQPLTKVSGQPFAIAEIEAAIATYFDGVAGNAGGDEVPPNPGQMPTIKSANP